MLTPGEPRPARPDETAAAVLVPSAWVVRFAGLIPAGGGCKEFAVRAAEWAAQSATPGEVFNFLQPVFQTIAMAKVAKSAVEAIDMGFAKPSDTILFNANPLMRFDGYYILADLLETPNLQQRPQKMLQPLRQRFV